MREASAGEPCGPSARKSRNRRHIGARACQRQRKIMAVARAAAKIIALPGSQYTRIGRVRADAAPPGRHNRPLASKLLINVAKRPFFAHLYWPNAVNK